MALIDGLRAFRRLLSSLIECPQLAHCFHSGTDRERDLRVELMRSKFGSGTAAVCVRREKAVSGWCRRMNRSSGAANARLTRSRLRIADGGSGRLTLCATARLAAARLGASCDESVEPQTSWWRAMLAIGAWLFRLRLAIQGTGFPEAPGLPPGLVMGEANPFSPVGVGFGRMRLQDHGLGNGGVGGAGLDAECDGARRCPRSLLGDQRREIIRPGGRRDRRCKSRPRAREKRDRPFGGLVAHGAVNGIEIVEAAERRRAGIGSTVPHDELTST